MDKVALQPRDHLAIKQVRVDAMSEIVCEARDHDVSAILGRDLIKPWQSIGAPPLLLHLEDLLFCEVANSKRVLKPAVVRATKHKMGAA
jgi:hypothetical protein